MKTTNRRPIKSITLTIDELRRMLATTAETGDTSAANQVIRRKISEKTERLDRQREQRRICAEQKKAMATKSECPESCERSERSSKTLNISLNRALATCILWINNRRTHLKNNIMCFIKEVARYTSHPTLKSIESALTDLLKLTGQTAEAAHKHLHFPLYSRPTTATVTLC